MSFLHDQIDELIKQAKKKPDDGEVRFSVTFSKYDNRRLEYVRRKLKLSKQELISKLVLAALWDIEERLELTEPLPGDDDDRTFTDEYHEILKSDRAISRYFKDKGGD